MDYHRLAEKRPLDLCETCASAFRNTVIDLSKRHSTLYHIHTTIDGFINAADQGCFICYNVLRSIGIPEQEIVRSIRDSIHHIKGVPREDSWNWLSSITCFFVSCEIQTQDISRLWITARMMDSFFIDTRWDYDPSVVPELQTQLHHMKSYLPIFPSSERFTFEVTMAQDLNSKNLHQSQVTSTSTASDETFSKVHNWIRGSNTEGLFFDRDMSQFSQPDIFLRLKTDKETDEVTYSYLVHDMQTWDREVAKAPLSSRGWIIQEWILPARTLHFYRREVFFECCEGAACERYFRGMPIFGRVKSPIHFKDLRLEARGNLESRGIVHWEDALGQKVYYYNAWTRIRDAYSSCSLTFATDKLVAISGICRYLKSHLSDDTYVAGVWLFNLASQMTWYCDSEELCLRRAEDQDVSKGRIAWDTSSTPASPGHPQTTPLREVVPLGWGSCGSSGRDDSIAWDIFGPVSANLVEVKVEGELKSAKLVDIGAKTLVVWPLIYDYDSRYMNPSHGWDSYSPHFVSARLDFAVSISDVPAFHERVFYYMPWREYQTDFGESFAIPYRESSSTLPQFLLFELVDINMGRFRRIVIFHASANDALEYTQSQPNEAELPCWGYNKETVKAWKKLYGKLVISVEPADSLAPEYTKTLLFCKYIKFLVATGHGRYLCKRPRRALSNLILERPFLKAAYFNRVSQTPAHFDDCVRDIHDLQAEDACSILTGREYLRQDDDPGPFAKPLAQESGRLGKRLPDEGNEVRRLELELELERLKSQKGLEAEAARGLAGDDDDDIW
ncbi:hypothetical protein B0J15DRAFT_470361 [Fusarium solani]|uniref:Uncharacterized protein n=1 Tax=Fusarium solani TaxID=169388 RepID=A0A9P9GL12_FUSSL|nr:uncharacterized protein B0J15DRAFT_470361 [Fusarium solani]KAH7240482.1 hypothetical protein B0J15DRAFT_470361 [Fusarium solani]